jgi:hypothetical protein
MEKCPWNNHISVDPCLEGSQATLYTPQRAWPGLNVERRGGGDDIIPTMLL